MESGYIASRPLFYFLLIFSRAASLKKLRESFIRPAVIHLLHQLVHFGKEIGGFQLAIFQAQKISLHGLHGYVMGLQNLKNLWRASMNELGHQYHGSRPT